MTEQRITLEIDDLEQKSVPKLNGVVIGILIDVNVQGMPLVAFPGNPNADSVAAKATIQLAPEDVGHEIALLFENGNPQRPIVIGRIEHQETSRMEPQPLTADVDGERVVLSAKKEIVLKCGKASITLTRAGKVIIRGAYLSSRSSGVNRIKGGSVQIN